MDPRTAERFMSQLIKSFGQGDPALTQYALDTFVPEDPILHEVRNSSAAAGLPTIHVGAMDGLHLEVITRAVGAKKAIEIGCLGGYSAICIARGLQPGGKLLSCELFEHNAAVARANLARAGLSHSVEVVVGDARMTLADLGARGPFDLVFIDADKANYQAYFEQCLQLLRPGGLILVDNVLWDGKVLEMDSQENNTRAIRAFNDTLLKDARVSISMLPIGDGLTLARKR
jgi:caffeoyl-CoA O-methyltransferase